MQILNDLFSYKQVILSCKFCQQFKYMEVLLSSWMSMWYLNMLGMWIEVLNHFENLLMQGMDFEIFMILSMSNILIVLCA